MKKYKLDRKTSSYLREAFRDNNMAKITNFIRVCYYEHHLSPLEAFMLARQINPFLYLDEWNSLLYTAGFTNREN